MDAWSHRSTSMRCRTCMFYVPKQTEREAKRYYSINEGKITDAMERGEPEQPTQLGRCRRHSPVVGQGWPAVFDDDWCGDHKLDENKR